MKPVRRGTYLGGSTVIRPGDGEWFGHSSEPVHIDPTIDDLIHSAQKKSKALAKKLARDARLHQQLKQAEHRRREQRRAAYAPPPDPSIPANFGQLNKRQKKRLAKQMSVIIERKGSTHRLRMSSTNKSKV